MGEEGPLVRVLEEEPMPYLKVLLVLRQTARVIPMKVHLLEQELTELVATWVQLLAEETLAAEDQAWGAPEALAVAFDTEGPGARGCT